MDRKRHLFEKNVGRSTASKSSSVLRAPINHCRSLTELPIWVPQSLEMFNIITNNVSLNGNYYLLSGRTTPLKHLDVIRMSSEWASSLCGSCRSGQFGLCTTQIGGTEHTIRYRAASRTVAADLSTQMLPSREILIDSRFYYQMT